MDVFSSLISHDFWLCSILWMLLCYLKDRLKWFLQNVVLTKTLLWI